MERWHVVGVVIALVLIGLALGSVRARAHRRPLACAICGQARSAR